MWLYSMCDLSSIPGIEPKSPAVETQNLNHWTACEVLCFLLFSSLEFGAHSPVGMTGVQCPYISQPIIQSLQMFPFAQMDQCQ